MKLNVLSDLHLHFSPFERPENDADMGASASRGAPGDRGLSVTTCTTYINL